jgi:hypothetical protein
LGKKSENLCYNPITDLRIRAPLTSKYLKWLYFNILQLPICIALMDANVRNQSEKNWRFIYSPHVIYQRLSFIGNKMNFKLAIAALATALTFSEGASAAVMTQTLNYGSAAAPVEAGGGTIDLTFNQFDSSLGTLQDVIITLNSFDTAQAEVLNLSSSPLSYSQSYVYNANETVSINGGPSTTTSTLETGHDSSNPNGFSGIAAPSGSGFVPTISGSGPTQAISTSSSVNISPFQGTSTVTVDLMLWIIAGTATSHVTGQANAIFAGWNANSYGNVQVQYDYLAVPEPCSYGIFAGVGLGLVALRRQWLLKA